mmetsp:Transcript_6636/g.14475  ORF Transcript_6636/g.14475 Transcript_6636/m.14475 type:complete len:326 (-) Transcript_6636:9-986(-)
MAAIQITDDDDSLPALRLEVIDVLCKLSIPALLLTAVGSVRQAIQSLATVGDVGRNYGELGKLDGEQAALLADDGVSVPSFTHSFQNRNAFRVLYDTLAHDHSNTRVPLLCCGACPMDCYILLGDHISELRFHTFHVFLLKLVLIDAEDVRLLLHKQVSQRLLQVLLGKQGAQAGHVHGEQPQQLASRRLCLKLSRRLRSHQRSILAQGSLCCSLRLAGSWLGRLVSRLRSGRCPFGLGLWLAFCFCLSGFGLAFRRRICSGRGRCHCCRCLRAYRTGSRLCSLGLWSFFRLLRCSSPLGWHCATQGNTEFFLSRRSGQLGEPSK